MKELWGRLERLWDKLFFLICIAALLFGTGATLLGALKSCESKERDWTECEKACAPYRASDCSREEAVCSSERIILLRRKP